MSDDRDIMPFTLFDAADDDLILAELKGEYVKTLAYSFSQDGKQVEGLSKKGIDAARDELARQGIIIREEMAHRPIIDDEAAYVSVVATRFIRQGETEFKADSAIASKRQPRKGNKRGGGTFDNPFFFEQATAKASRNAVDRHIPEELRQKIIALAKTQGQIVDVTPKAKQVSDTPPTKTVAGAITEQTITVIRTRRNNYAEIHGKDKADDFDKSLKRTASPMFNNFIGLSWQKATEEQGQWAIEQYIAQGA